MQIVGIEDELAIAAASTQGRQSRQQRSRSRRAAFAVSQYEAMVVITAKFIELTDNETNKAFASSWSRDGFGCFTKDLLGLFSNSFNIHIHTVPRTTDTEHDVDYRSPDTAEP